MDTEVGDKCGDESSLAMNETSNGHDEMGTRNGLETKRTLKKKKKTGTNSDAKNNKKRRY